MNIDKQFWKTIYYWIRYLNFDIVSREKDDQEIWLAHKRKKQVVILNNISSLPKKYVLTKRKCLNTKMK
ncbi:Putative membrane peptidase, contains TPR repeat domain [Staphylococcus aureus]|nr:Putative membrane peptidase, contains TPR repeat domain [Staphylococcus aureus]